MLPWTEPFREFKSRIGLEDFITILTNPSRKAKMYPDVVHCHSLHSIFSTLNIFLNFPEVPIFITLHDCWMLTGHCVHPYECEQWKTQCSKCPYPNRPIKTKRDACRWNQNRKKNIYKRSKFYISAPSQWLTSMAKNSILNLGAVEFREHSQWG